MHFRFFSFFRSIVVSWPASGLVRKMYLDKLKKKLFRTVEQYIRTSIHVRILDSTAQERGSFKKWHVLTINYSQLGSKLLFHHENQARSLITHVDFGFVTCLGWENTTSVFPTSATDGSLYKSTQDQELQRAEQMI